MSCPPAPQPPPALRGAPRRLPDSSTFVQRSGLRPLSPRPHPRSQEESLAPASATPGCSGVALGGIQEPHVRGIKGVSCVQGQRLAPGPFVRVSCWAAWLWAGSPASGAVHRCRLRGGSRGRSPGSRCSGHCAGLGPKSVPACHGHLPRPARPYPCRPPGVRQRAGWDSRGAHPRLCPEAAAVSGGSQRASNPSQRGRKDPSPGAPEGLSWLQTQTREGVTRAAAGLPAATAACRAPGCASQGLARRTFSLETQAQGPSGRAGTGLLCGRLGGARHVGGGATQWWAVLLEGWGG